MADSFDAAYSSFFSNDSGEITGVDCDVSDSEGSVFLEGSSL